MKEKNFFYILIIILTISTILFVHQGVDQTQSKNFKLYESVIQTKAPIHSAISKQVIADNVYITIEPQQKLGSDGQLHDAFMNGDITITKGHKVSIHFYNYDKKIHSYSSPELGVKVIIKASHKTGTPQITTYTFTPQKQGLFPWFCHIPYNTTHDEWAMSHDGFMRGTITVLPSSNKTQYLSLVVNHDYKLGNDGHLHDAYTPGDFTVAIDRPVKLTIYNYSDDPHPFGISLLGFNMTVNQRIKAGKASIWSDSFIIKQAGQYQWNCLVPCDETYHQYAMLYDGYMMGTITAK